MKRKKITAALLSLLLLAGCTASAGNQGKETIVFQDDLNRTVHAAKPERTAALIGSFADCWITAGGKESLKAAAHDAWTSFDLDLDEDVIDLGSVKTPNIELILESSPDLVIASAKSENSPQIIELLETAGIPVACFDVSSFEDYLHMLKICTELTGNEEAYQEYGLKQKELVEQAKAMNDGSHPQVLYIRSAGSSIKSKNSSGSVLGEMLKDLGAENIADSSAGLLETLSLEAIIEADPEYIFLVIQGTQDSKAARQVQEMLLDQPAWQALSAVKNGKFYLMDQKLYNLKPNARWGEAYLNLAEILYGKGEQKTEDEN